jgi:hypothetical protein
VTSSAPFYFGVCYDGITGRADVDSVANVDLVGDGGCVCGVVSRWFDDMETRMFGQKSAACVVILLGSVCWGQACPKMHVDTDGSIGFESSGDDVGTTWTQMWIQGAALNATIPYAGVNCCYVPYNTWSEAYYRIGLVDSAEGDDCWWDLPDSLEISFVVRVKYHAQDLVREIVRFGNRYGDMLYPQNDSSSYFLGICTHNDGYVCLKGMNGMWGYNGGGQGVFQWDVWQRWVVQVGITQGVRVFIDGTKVLEWGGAIIGSGWPYDALKSKKFSWIGFGGEELYVDDIRMTNIDYASGTVVPSNVQAVDLGGGQVRLAWDSQLVVVGWEVQRAGAANFSGAVSWYAPGDFHYYYDASVQAGHHYWYRVRAIFYDGSHGGWSGSADVAVSESGGGVFPPGNYDPNDPNYWHDPNWPGGGGGGGGTIPEVNDVPIEGAKERVYAKLRRLGYDPQIYHPGPGDNWDSMFDFGTVGQTAVQGLVPWKPRSGIQWWSYCEQIRSFLRLFFGVIMSFIFINKVWEALRQA